MVLLNVIKFEGDDKTLVWKHPAEDFNTQSQLIVHESQEAILYKNGQALDLFGPGRHRLTSQNMPILRKLINMPTGGVSAFHCEVYFINKAVTLNVEWGTPSKFQVLDSTFNVPLDVGASGNMEFKIKNSRKFLIEVVGTQRSLNSSQLTQYFKGKIITKVKSYLAKVMSQISYLVVNQNLEDISEAIKEKLAIDFNFYGVNLINFYLNNIIIPGEQTEKIREVLNKKLEYGTLGFNWADEQIAEISKRYASNPGMQDSVGGMMAQIPVALAFGEMLKGNIAGNITSGFANKSEAFSFNKPNEIKEENPRNHSNIGDNTKFCPDCGNQLDFNLKCNDCGLKFTYDESGNLDKISPNKCDKCGFEVDENHKFCPECGNKMTN
ncbi:MAG: SPFH domain-containing protein [Methanobrevibacter sp.]|jgi:membrane protease subunit (stomatin/prohibitin family)|nr:SPFH domain-containing protein [Methanobrevibacter sp.]